MAEEAAIQPKTDQEPGSESNQHAAPKDILVTHKKHPLLLLYAVSAGNMDENSGECIHSPLQSILLNFDLFNHRLEFLGAIV